MKMHNRKKLRIFIMSVLILSFMVLLTGLISCKANEQQPQNTNKDESTGGSTQESETPAEKPTEARIYPDLPAMDFEGYQFNVLHWGTDSWNSADMSSEELDGDVFNDAVYNRNRKIVSCRLGYTNFGQRCYLLHDVQQERGA